MPIRQSPSAREIRLARAYEAENTEIAVRMRYCAGTHDALAQSVHIAVTLLEPFSKRVSFCAKVPT